MESLSEYYHRYQAAKRELAEHLKTHPSPSIADHDCGSHLNRLKAREKMAQDGGAYAAGTLFSKRIQKDDGSLSFLFAKHFIAASQWCELYLDLDGVTPSCAKFLNGLSPYDGAAVKGAPILVPNYALMDWHAAIPESPLLQGFSEGLGFTGPRDEKLITDLLYERDLMYGLVEEDPEQSRRSRIDHPRNATMIQLLVRKSVQLSNGRGWAP